MENKYIFKNTLGLILQWLGALIGFLVCLVVSNLLLPLPKNIMDAVPPSGFLTAPLAFVFSGAVNATILVWAARRSSFKNLALWAGLFVVSFGVQVFETQIETGYFISAFPLLHGNFVVYLLVLRGLITSLLFTLLITLMVGGFSHRPRATARFAVNANHAIKMSAWLAAVYVALYMLFGYFVAWQSQELRLFYGGPAVLNSFVNQWLTTLMAKPELPVFQYFRGVLWILCLLPLFKGFTGRRIELVALAALALGLLPTAQLAFANPLMPASVSYFHFWEVSISTGIFGALCAWFIPEEVRSTSVE